VEGNASDASSQVKEIAVRAIEREKKKKRKPDTLSGEHHSQRIQNKSPGREKKGGSRKSF